jgi:SLT domain-containing protein
MNITNDNLSYARTVLDAFDAISQADGKQFHTRDALDVLTIVRWESFGDPTAVNTTDINAQEGHPSQGDLQVIPETFTEFALAPHNVDINDPLSNTIAGVRYALKRYGSLENVPGIKALRAADQGKYVGY